MSPFDEARYARLLEGLEVSEIGLREAMEGTDTSRIDPEYFNRAALDALQMIKGDLRLGDMVLEGYRVVYETTEAIAREVGEKEGLPYFLQAADISTPFINAGSMICVAESDWVRYPKGRVHRGELLIEVKGKAEKIALVPDDFPKKTLVSGTCFKLTTKDRVDQYFLAAYLTSRYGQLLKNRLKSNLLVSYLAKDDLYRLPVPYASSTLKSRIQAAFDACFEWHSEAEALMTSAETTLLNALGLDGWESLGPHSYVRNSSETFAASRLDAEFFTPHVQDMLTRLGRDGITLQDVAPSRRERFTPAASGAFHYIEIGGIGADGTAQAECLSQKEAPSRATQYVRTGDVITSTVRPIRRLSAIIDAGQDGYVCSSGFVVLQPQEIRPEVLLAYLRLPPVCALMDLHTSASMYPAISEADLLALPIPEIPAATQQAVEKSVRAARQAKQRATQLLNAAKRAVEIAIEDSEAAALAYLKSREG